MKANRRHPLTLWREPVVTILSMTAAIALVNVVDSAPGALVLAAVLTMSLSRSHLVESWRGRLEALVLLPVIGLATTGVGEVIRLVPIVGAALFVLAMSVAIWLRRYGAVGRRVGSLVTLPFLTLLIVPGGGGGTPVWGVILISVLALGVVVAVRLLAELVRLLPRSVREPAPVAPRDSSLRPIPSTRMAIQMLVGLVAAVIVGALVFPDHVTWVVLTAYLVASGNRGRADVLYKSGLRIVGATAGTLVAAAGVGALAGHPLLQGPPLVLLLLGILGVGLWLRQWTYAAWAVAVTLVITLLQGVAFPAATVPVGERLWERVLAIVVGAVCGVVAAWFVLPIRSESVVRRRVGDALAALSEFVGDRTPENDARLEGALDRLDEIAQPWVAWERGSRWRRSARKPGEWMRLVHESARLARERAQLSGDARRALGQARRSMREPDAIGAALAALRDELAA